MAAGIAYYALFSLFPLLLGIVAVIDMLGLSQPVQDSLFRMTGQFLPGSGGMVVGNIESVIESREIGLVSLLILVWSSSSVFEITHRSLNRAWAVEKERPFILSKLVDTGMAIGIGLLFLLSVGMSAVLNFAWQLTTPAIRDLEGGTLWRLALGLTPLIVSFVLFSLVYRFMPDAKVRWLDAMLGALLAAVLFEFAKILFGWYLIFIANYSLVYGSLAAVMALLFWAYVSAVILLVGAEFAAAYARLHGAQKPGPSVDDLLVAEEENTPAPG